MRHLSATILETLWRDPDQREEQLREVVHQRLSESPPPVIDDCVVASYFFAFRSQTLAHGFAEIAYHATSGIKHPPRGSLLEACTARPAGIDAFDATERMGLVHVAFPLKMLLSDRETLTSTDLLHTTAGAIQFDVYENLDARLVNLQLPAAVIRGFPGPAHGPAGVRALTGFGPQEPAFGTILKPTAGITPDEVGRLVEEAAACPLFLFIKEDENLYPELPYSPVGERVRQATAGIARSAARRGRPAPIFAPHITCAPHRLAEVLEAALEAGATGVMLSESFAGGAVRWVREATRHRPVPPAIYGHNAGIGVRTRAIWREVIDYLARLDGIDFRQTAPVRPGTPFLRPYGREWEKSEEVLTREIPGIKPVMIARAGGLDQGNLCLNLADAEARGIVDKVLFLAGSAINSIKNEQGVADPRVGAQAMIEAATLHREGALAGVSAEGQVPRLRELARQAGYHSLLAALEQRYPRSGT